MFVDVYLPMIKYILFSVLKILCIIVPLLISVAYFTLVERKILGAIQRRRGPNVIGVYGLLQPLSDGLKLLTKEALLPSLSNSWIFIVAPLLTFFLSLISWAGVPYFNGYALLDINVNFLYIFAISSLGIYGVIMSGWSSNSQYSFLGALRSTAQMISYEVSIGFIMLIIATICGSFNSAIIVDAQKYNWFILTYFPLFLVFFISGLAETNRHPFDLPEAEAELVSGYNVEYSSMSFALFSLGEYSNILMMSVLNVILFLGGWRAPCFLPEILIKYYEKIAIILPFLNCNFGIIWFGLKVCLFVILFVWMRAVLPRYRYDQLMVLGWKVFLPITLFFFFLNCNNIILNNTIPY